MDLTENPEIVNWPKTHYVYIEKVGPFQETAPQAWQQVHKIVPEILEHHKITGYMSLYKIEGEKMTYRAGVALAAKPTTLPDGLRYTLFPGGKYSRFVLTGSFSNLPEASGRVCEIVIEKKIQRRNDFGIEHYVNDPRTTPEEKLVTEILVPTA